MTRKPKGRTDSDKSRVRNSPSASISRALVRGFEQLGIRGAPTLLRLLSTFGSVRAVPATVELGEQVVTFPAYDEYWCRYLWAEVPYEEEIARIFRKFGKGSVLIDGGANIGYWSVRAATFGFNSVIAVEPNRAILPYLRENFRLNSIPGEIVEAAIHSESGKVLHLNVGDAHAESRLGDAGVAVSTVSVSDLLKDYPADQEVIAKLDVEGAEIAAIEGARGRDKLIFIYEDFRYFGMETTRELLKRGMTLIGVEDTGKHCRISSMDDAFAFRGPAHVGAVNLIAVDARRADEVEARLSAPDL